MLVAEALRRRIQALGIEHQRSVVAKTVTVSCGVAALVPSLELNSGNLIRLADTAPYRAKEGGRNQVVASRV